MLKPLLAFLASAALPAAALSQDAAPGEWTVSASGNGCIAYSAFAQDTVVSLLAGRGQDQLIFMIQNKRWSSLEDGSQYPLAVQLDGRNKFEFEAVAKTELDSDGPGLLFTVSPGEQEGAKFLAAFANAAGMDVGESGRSLAHLQLAGGQSAMAQLAQCMAEMWGGGQGKGRNPALATSAATARPL